MFSPRSLTKNMYPLPTITVYLVCGLNVNTENFDDTSITKAVL